MTKYKLEQTDLTEDDLLEEIDNCKCGLSTGSKIIIIISIILVIAIVAILGIVVGKILKDITTDDSSSDNSIIGTITIDDKTKTNVDYTTSNTKCIFVLKFPEEGVYTCCIYEEIDSKKSAKKVQTFLVKNIDEEYTFIFDKFNPLNDYTITIHKNKTGD